MKCICPGGGWPRVLDCQLSGRVVGLILRRWKASCLPFKIRWYQRDFHRFRWYRRHLMKEKGVSDKCRMCFAACESNQHVKGSEYLRSTIMWSSCTTDFDGQAWRLKGHSAKLYEPFELLQTGPVKIAKFTWLWSQIAKFEGENGGQLLDGCTVCDWWENWGDIYST